MSFNNALYFCSVAQARTCFVECTSGADCHLQLMALKKPRVSNVKAVRHVYPEEAKSSEARSVYACTLQHHSVGV